ncbi:LysR family transcriptional regulator [Tatumella citrea]|uniref:LysR family transcriptional regulator n=1 Tax=Tatumella citrea TaxID=53336 RepID=A0A1Y0L7J6_TATCI|nr:LysR family transcriptional regulator [Tatumella citrea]ARU94001.1 LysR family transcriptional regulator [Tatumella citrea]ARU98039.1 LysR family transcriptional regulator [Tatumella citrea]
MPSYAPDWDDIRFFLNVARSQSLTKTSAQLNVSQSTVSRRIQSLEQRLQVRLFTRHQSGYYLTESGSALLQYAEQTEESILQLESHLTGTDRRPEGTVRLATTDLLASQLIIPALPEFMHQYPRIRLEIITGISEVSMSRHDADLALRMVRPQQNSLKVRRAGEIPWSVLGHQEYLNSYPSESQWQFICWDSAWDHLPSARWVSEHFPHNESALITTSLNHQIAAANAGLGVAVLPDFVTRHYSQLQAADGRQQIYRETVWMVSHGDLLESARVRAVADFLLAVMATG